MHRIVIIGGGGHAKVLISILKKIDSFEVLGYTDIQDNGPLLGINYLGPDDCIDQMRQKVKDLNAVIGIGSLSAKDAHKRKKLFDKYTQKDIRFPSICSPGAIINEDVRIGPATVIMDGVVINTGTDIGTGVIVNTGSSVDHDCTISDFVHIAPGVTLSGGVKIGENTLIGTGSSVIQSVQITQNTIIAAGSCVTKDLKVSGTYRGVPVRKIL